MIETTIRRDDGTSYDLHNLTTCTLEDYAGMGMAPLTLRTEQGPQQHGFTYRDFRLQQRYVSLVLGLRATSVTARYAAFRELHQVFAPGQMRLRRVFDDGSEREIVCYTHVGPDDALGDRLGYGQKVAITLLAPDPTWYDPSRVVVNFGITAGGTGTPVPTTVATSVGASAIEITKTIAYAGDWRAYPVIRIVGPITDPRIENLTTDEVLDISGITIAAGHWYEVDCRYGYKTVVSDSGTNEIGKLSSDSDLATFHLSSVTEAIGGNNSVRVTGSGANSDTNVLISYNTRYLGG